MTLTLICKKGYGSKFYFLTQIKLKEHSFYCCSTFHSHSRIFINEHGPGGSMSQVVGLPHNSYKPITNTAWIHARLCKLQKRVHSQPQVIKFTSCLPMVGSSLPVLLTSSTTKTRCHDIAEILLKVPLNTKNQIKSNH